MLEDFLRRLARLEFPAGQRVLLAVSGGPDSVVLLDLMARGAPVHGLDLVVGHVDHGITSASADAAALVERLAEERGLRSITGHLHLGPAASETDAREMRYRWLEETRIREKAEWIFTAHHAADQAETVLLRLLHGSGPAGLAGMALRRDRIVRPLLGADRSALVRYRAERDLPAWDDPANTDDRHFRSWVRGKLLPFIRQRVPGVELALLAVAEQAGRDRLAWDRVIDVLPGLDWRQESPGGSVAVAPFAGYDSTLGGAVLRAMGRRAGCVLSRDHAGRVFDFLGHPESGSRLDVGNGWRFEIVFDRVYLVPAGSQAVDTGSSAGLRVEGDAGDGDLGRWRLFWRYEKAPPVQERDALTAWFIPQALQIRRWSAGDKVFPLGGRGRRLVVRCFQDAKIPRHLRDEWPMVTEAAGEIVWVPGVCRSNRLVPPAGAEALRVDAQVI